MLVLGWQQVVSAMHTAPEVPQPHVPPQLLLPHVLAAHEGTHGEQLSTGAACRYANQAVVAVRPPAAADCVASRRTWVPAGTAGEAVAVNRTRPPVRLRRVSSVTSRVGVPLISACSRLTVASLAVNSSRVVVGLADAVLSPGSQLQAGHSPCVPPHPSGPQVFVLR